MYYFKDYIHQILEETILKHRIKGPFLEVGCGKGENLAFLSALGLSGIGIDLNPRALEKARQFLELDQNVVLLKSNLFDMQGSFKLVIALDVIEHIEDDRKALRKIYDLLTPDSHAVIAVPGGPFMADDIAFGHYRRYSRKSLIKALEDSRFEVEDCITVGYPFLHYARIGANLMTRRAKKQAPKEVLESNTLESDMEHPLKNTVFSKALNAVLERPAPRASLYSMLNVQKVFSKWPTGHTFLAIAKPIKKAAPVIKTLPAETATPAREKELALA